jgi:hypothetical protein
MSEGWAPAPPVPVTGASVDPVDEPPEPALPWAPPGREVDTPLSDSSIADRGLEHPNADSANTTNADAQTFATPDRPRRKRPCELLDSK